MDIYKGMFIQALVTATSFFVTHFFLDYTIEHVITQQLIAAFCFMVICLYLEYLSE